MNYTFQIHHHTFDNSLTEDIRQNSYVNQLWPLVYIISDGKKREAYIGETTDAISRMSSHLKNDKKRKLTTVHLITSEFFNKSATLDIESNLIRYISADGNYNLINGNLGIANHTYFQKQVIYWELFKNLWIKLRKEGLVKNTIETINNSDIFKYSPYKSLSVEQNEGMLLILKSLLEKNKKSIIIEGGAGTGKTILAVYLFKLLHTDITEFYFKDFGEKSLEILEITKRIKEIYPNPKMGLVVPMSSFRHTLKKVFSSIKGLSGKMVLGPAEVADEKFDILLVDESHRLRKRINLGAYFGAFDKVNEKLKLDKFKANELDWMLKQSDKQILFYDSQQSIKPSDVDRLAFEKIRKHAIVFPLNSQFRVKGGVDYVKYINDILDQKITFQKFKPQFKQYEFYLFDDLSKMIKEIKKREAEFGLCRMVAGYSWKWNSKNGAAFDISIGKEKLLWNTVDKDWVNSKNAINEVGCIHTTQGYDLNYTGIIFGHEITFNNQTKSIEIIDENYYDKNGKNSIEDPEILKSYIINIYKTLMLRGIQGTFVFACNKDLNNYLSQFIPIYGEYLRENHLTAAAE